jgi:hypothetical protein
MEKEMNPEQSRLAEDRDKKRHWRRWGSYLSEREWGTVREDYSANGDAWNYFPFSQAASRAYRWGEDGIAGLCDNHQKVCFSFAFWNEKDPILKERLFGLSNPEGTHGEDVKECYYYLDNTPTHSYMKALYKYPQEAFPYDRLRNEQRGLDEPEFELIDTGVFDEDRYFDLFIEYAKADPEDLLIRLTVCNRSKEKKKLHVLPQLWLRNTWSWEKRAAAGNIGPGSGCLNLTYEGMEPRFLYFEQQPALLFADNETNFQKLFGSPNGTPYPKDAIGNAVIQGKKSLAKSGTKAAIHYELEVDGGKETTIRLRFVDRAMKSPFQDFDKVFQKRKAEADLFYEELATDGLCEELKSIQRQAFAGLLWSKQFYYYVVEEWLKGEDPPPPTSRNGIRNFRWRHLYNEDILSMPDKWEYPWYASWDLAFHCIPMAQIDPEFAKKQLALLTREWYMHPNGQVPAYEWNFEEVNPPVLAWAAWRVYKIEQRKQGREDRGFLEGIFQKLVMNFTWWVNRKDRDEKNVFEGGFLGLDNISVFNRNTKLPLESKLIQSDATSWMAAFCLNMWTIAVELAVQEPIYEDMASKFFEHFLYIADAMNYELQDIPPLWDEKDGFYYDLLQRKDGSFQRIKVRSMVGLIPLFAVAVLDQEKLDSLPAFKKRFEWFLKNRGDLCGKVACMETPGVENRRLFSIVQCDQLKRILEKALDEKEFLSPFGLRSVSKYHKDNPFVLQCGGGILHRVDYEPAESSSKLFGGNSNWRGPVWFPLNYLAIEALQKFHYYHGDKCKVEYPTGSGNLMTLNEVAQNLSERLMKIFRKEGARRPVFGSYEKFQKDPQFRDYILFHEYYHGETGAGLGASHQTGWTALVAKLIQQSGTLFLH